MNGDDGEYNDTDGVDDDGDDENDNDGGTQFRRDWLRRGFKRMCHHHRRLKSRHPRHCGCSNRCLRHSRDKRNWHRRRGSSTIVQLFDEPHMIRRPGVAVFGVVVM